MSLASLAPVFLRELRLSRRRTGHWRSNWRWLLGTCIGCAALIVAMNVHGMNIVHLAQFVVSLAGTIIALMPLGFAADRQAGQQSLLRLTGLGPLQVFTASAAGSLYAVLELWLCCVPLLLIGFSISRTRPASALLAIACVGALFLWLGSLRILGAAASRTRSGMVLISLIAGAGLVLPALLDFWLGHRLSPDAGQILHLLGGAESWMGFSRAIQPRGPTAPLWSILGRLLVWSFLLLSIAAAFFRSDWLQNEHGAPVRSQWRHWLQTRLNSPNRRSRESNPYLARYPEPQGWVRAQWTLAALIGVIGLGLASAWSWYVLPCALALGIGLVDILAHLVVSGVVAADRREGAFELLLTTPLRPTQILAAGHEVGREIIRSAALPGLCLLGAFVGMAFLLIPPADRNGLKNGFIALSFGTWPVWYAVALAHLPFRLPVSQAANTGEPFHAFSFPQTAFLIPVLTGLGAWALSAGNPPVRMGAATCGLLMIIVWLVVREQFASSRGLSEEDLRLVAAAPLPTEECIPKDNRTTRPWVPEGFQR
ncbi:MAG: hypothetical protein RIS76_2223 [Verrucomicrobiota bacterium]|jgi:hypothetical protein